MVVSVDYSPLSSWLDRMHTMPHFSKIQSFRPNLEIGGWVGITRAMCTQFLCLGLASINLCLLELAPKVYMSTYPHKVEVANGFREGSPN